MFQRLFSPITINGMQLRNRIVMPPMVTLLGNEDGTVSQRMIDYYARRAEGGAALIEIEACTVDPQHFMISPRQLRVSHDRFIAGFSRLTRALHAQGAKVALQLQHPGRETFTDLTGVQPVAPSPLRSPLKKDVPRELSLEEISLLVENFAEGARRAQGAGFDAVEIHGAHGYLISQFLSGTTNKRTDRYGGDTNGRVRFALEAVRRTREKVGKDYPIIFRISAAEFQDQGLTLEETRVMASKIEEAGADVISVSAGSQVTLEWGVQPMLFRQGCIIHLAAGIKEVVKVPVIGVGRITDPRMAERFLVEGKADLIALGRPLIADPDFPHKAKEGREAEIRRCIACNSCTAAIAATWPIGCLMNPEAGREGERETGAERAKRVLVLGAGPSGMEAARVAALRGHQVTLWEERKLIPGHWSWLIKPYIPEQVRKLKQAGVKVELGKTVTREAISEMRPDVVIATMSASSVMPRIPGIDQDNVFLAQEVLGGKAQVGKAQVGKKVAILGAGSIGCETAEFLRRQGAKVTLLEPTGRVAYGLDYCARRVTAERLRQKRVQVITGAEVTKIQGKKLTYKDQEGEKSLQADAVVIALGSKTDNKIVEALQGGDYQLLPATYCEEPLRAYRAALDGRELARTL